MGDHVNSIALRAAHGQPTVMAPWLVGAALVLTTATQLRSHLAPVGPGEVLLLSWVALVLSKPILRAGRAPSSGPLFAQFFLFWFVAWMLLGIGALVAAYEGVMAPSDSFRDGAALGLVTLFVLAFCAETRTARDFTATLLPVVAITTFGSILLMVVALFSPSLGPVTFWLGKRFIGWASNPNQYALLLVPAPFLAIFLARISRRRIVTVSWTCVAMILIPIGLAVGSDALVIAWLVGASIGIVFSLWATVKRVGRTPAEQLLTRTVFAGLGFLAGAGIIIGALATAKGIVASIAAEQGQGVVRLILWLNAARAISESPLVGFGPGKYSGFLAPFQHREAHNTVLDWGMSTGLLGVLILTLLLMQVAWNAWRSPHRALFGAAIALLVFIQFHYALRHPLMWFWLIAIMGLSRWDYCISQHHKTSQRGMANLQVTRPTFKSVTPHS